MPVVEIKGLKLPDVGRKIGEHAVSPTTHATVRRISTRDRLTAHAVVARLRFRPFRPPLVGIGTLKPNGTKRPLFGQFPVDVSVTAVVVAVIPVSLKRAAKPWAV